MRLDPSSSKFPSSKWFALAASALLVVVTGLASAVAPPNRPTNNGVDLGNIPPDISATVAPNIVLTFDNSGSMASQFIPDAASTTTALRFYSSSWNLEYFDPTKTYLPPLNPDGSSMGNASYIAAWVDGICANRPTGGPAKCAIGTQGPEINTSGSGPLTGRCYTFTTSAVVKGKTVKTTHYSCDFFPYSNTSQVTDYRGYNYAWTGTGASVGSAPPFAAVPVVNLSNNFGATFGTASACTTVKGTTTCYGDIAGGLQGTNASGPTMGSAPVTGENVFRAMGNSTLNGVTGTIGGFYATNTAAKGCVVANPANTCYSVTLLSSQNATVKQNFANWYSYYRFRNAMARTGVSRSFGILGSNIRVAWQNIARNSGDPNITLLNDGNTASIDSFTGTLHTNFFNWLYAISATTNTPNRAAVIRASQFFQQGAGPVTNTQNPYWDTNLGRELTCRQNFQMLVTDGYWNEQNPSNASTLNPVDATAVTKDNVSLTLPDGHAYTADASQPESKIFWNETRTTGSKGCSDTGANSGDNDCNPWLSDIAFYYWSTNLRPDFGVMNVPSYFPDTTTGVTNTIPLGAGQKPETNDEIYFNPVNDPATWPHVVQYIIGLGVPGSLIVPPQSPPPIGDVLPADVGDYTNMRTGASKKIWPDVINNNPKALDDTWHATLNSRGGYFNAGNPQSLTAALDNVLNTIIARAGTLTGESVSSSILTQGSVGFQGSYDPSSWTGNVQQQSLDPATGQLAAVLWDAASKMPTTTNRKIFTSCGTAGALKKAAFDTTGLSDAGCSAELADLNLDPTKNNPDTSTDIVPATSPGVSDTFASLRIAYMRGDRSHESSGSTPTFRNRGGNVSLPSLGAIINSQPTYVGGPGAGWLDIYPAGSLEQAAAAPCIADPKDVKCNSYENFVKTNLDRTPVVYVGANDGMLHAFDASAAADGGGVEKWAYVPNMLYPNGQLIQLSNHANGLVTTVDSTPVIQDICLPDSTRSACTWHTILIGSMRLGARGIFALDVTSPDATSDSDAANKFLWEFSSADNVDLGYTYMSANVARIRYNGGTWVVLLSSGYFPDSLSVQTNGASKIVSTPAAKANQTHLLVLDASNGKLIKELDTTAGVVSYGLSTPNAVDFGLDQIDDTSVAGDLAGNLWRFDLSDPNPSNWKVDNIFQSYTSTASIGYEPITVMPVTFPDPTTGSVIYVFGSGEYLGDSDKTSGSLKTAQHFFGVRDYGTGSTKYPITQDKLVAQTLTEDTDTGARSLTDNAVPATSPGWKITLTTQPGERNTVTAVPLFSVGIAVLTSLIPGSSDPCTPGRLGAIIAVNAATGGPTLAPATAGGSSVVGGLVKNPPATGSLGAISQLGGGSIVLPGVPPACPPGSTHCQTTACDGTDPNCKNPASLPNGIQPTWRRTSWRELLNDF
jgi:type IV pilus assembly protein PilY1